MRYNIVMFAYNEEKNIVNSINSVFDSIDSDLNKFFLIVNGSTDKTLEIALQQKDNLEFEKMEIKNIQLGDKCNAWNTYIHEYSGLADVHFFIDADVKFSDKCFSKMAKKLHGAPDSTAVVAGMPLSGRNRDFYLSLIKERSCFFGNLYGFRNTFVDFIKQKNFRLPIGLNWIDSFLTKAANTNLQFTKQNLPNRTTYIEGVGYSFDSLSLVRLDDIKLYINRIARYELGKLQEVFLDELSPKDWPESMDGINLAIQDKFDEMTNELSAVKKHLVKKRLVKLINKSRANA